jgi:8-oxo-dGTP pyrophosphatase MutT (NUDIX family)
MINIQSTRINTAGAYVCFNGLYLFAIGFRPYHGHTPIVRLGGHREGHETGWQCAAREVHEEANLLIKPFSPPTTYLSYSDPAETELKEIEWERTTEQEPAPILVVAYQHEENISLSLMYFAHAEGLPTPSSEVKGILLLGEEEIHGLCQESLTLEQYLSKGGKAILSGDFDIRLVLEPFIQLQLLSRILRKQSKNKTLTARDVPYIQPDVK